MPKAARLGDNCAGHGCFPPTPIIAGSGDVSINGMPAARKGDAVLLHACPCPYVPHGVHGRSISAGSSNVSINGKPAARVGDAIGCGGSVSAGSGDVFIGDTPYNSPAHDCGEGSAQKKSSFLRILPLVEPTKAIWTCPPYIEEAITKAAEKGESAVPLEGVVANKGTLNKTTDFIEDTRPVSGKTGFLNSSRLSRSELGQLKSDLNAIGIEFQKNADKDLNKFGKKVRGGFDWSNKTVFLRKGATKYEAFHEFSHAKQFSEIGKDAYVGLGRYARESYVFNQVVKNRHLFSHEERMHAVSYMKDLKQLYKRGRIN